MESMSLRRYNWLTCWTRRFQWNTSVTRIDYIICYGLAKCKISFIESDRPTRKKNGACGFEQLCPLDI